MEADFQFLYEVETGVHFYEDTRFVVRIQLDTSVHFNEETVFEM